MSSPNNTWAAKRSPANKAFTKNPPKRIGLPKLQARSTRQHAAATNSTATDVEFPPHHSASKAVNFSIFPDITARLDHRECVCFQDWESQIYFYCLPWDAMHPTQNLTYEHKTPEQAIWPWPVALYNMCGMHSLGDMGRIKGFDTVRGLVMVISQVKLPELIAENEKLLEEAKEMGFEKQTKKFNYMSVDSMVKKLEWVVLATKIISGQDERMMGLRGLLEVDGNWVRMLVDEELARMAINATKYLQAVEQLNADLIDALKDLDIRRANASRGPQYLGKTGAAGSTGFIGALAVAPEQAASEKIARDADIKATQEARIEASRQAKVKASTDAAARRAQDAQREVRIPTQQAALRVSQSNTIDGNDSASDGESDGKSDQNNSEYVEDNEGGRQRVRHTIEMSNSESDE